MSNTIDHRIVEMRFDNKQFESGAKQTIGTLSKLREALKLPNTEKSLDGIDKAAKNISLDGLSAGVEALNKRFSTFGIVGMRVIENITDGLMNKLHTAVNFVTDSIVSGGIKRAMNIENAHFQLQALLKDETKVQAVMADAMESVDGTAYAYDEAAKAASQFAASGIEAGEDMLGALKGITGVAAMTNSSFEDISRIFTTVAGNGRLMGDQLLQLSSRGLNAASTLADYFREVRGQSNMTEASIRELVSKGKISFKDFSDAMTWAFGDSAKRANETFTGALSNMKSALARIGAGFISPLVEQNGELVKLFNALRVQINNVKSNLIFDEQASAMSGLKDATKMTNLEIEAMFSKIKRNGKVSIDDIDKLTKRGANATIALRKYINGVSDGSIRASYAITNTVNELTNGTKVSMSTIRRFVNEGKIDLNVFTSAMEESFGNQRTISKRFTDFFLNTVKSLVMAIETTDLTKPLEAFNHGVNATTNVFKGLWSVVRPLGKAFADVFLNFSGDDLVNFSISIEKITEKMRLSEKGSKNLHDTFYGVFSVVKLLTDGILKLFGISTSALEPVGSLTELFLALAGGAGRGLTAFTGWIRKSPVINRVFNKLSSSIKILMYWLSYAIDHVDEFTRAFYNLPIVQKMIKIVVDAFNRFGVRVNSSIESIIKKIKEFRDWISKIVPEKAGKMLRDLSKDITQVINSLDNINLSNLTDMFGKFSNKIRELSSVIKGNIGLETFVTNMRTFFRDLKDGFTFNKLFDNIDKFQSKVGGFIKWVKKNVGDLFSGFSFGGAVATAGSLGMLYAFIKSVKAFEKLTGSIKAIPDLLGAIKGTLTAYQNDLKASALIKVAGAIAILAGAITVLSFADMKRAWQATIMLGLIATALMTAMGTFADAVTRTKTVNDALYMFSKTTNNLAKAVKWKAIGSAFKDFGITILMIAGSIIALGIMYRKDPKAMTAAAELVAMIAAVLVGIMASMSIVGSIFKSGMQNFSKASVGVLALSASLGIIIGALNKLFKMDFPSDWDEKFAILTLIMGELAALSLIMGVASRIGGGNKISSTPFVGLAAMLYVTVLSLEKLFKMNLPNDYGEKFTILMGIFTALGALMITVGVASKIAGGQMKATGTILAMAAFIAVLTASLMILTIIPGDKLLKGATALGLVLIALGVALVGAGKITSRDAYKSVLAMALTTGAIVAALSFLSLIPFDKLLKSIVSLGSIFAILALTFNQVSKITDQKAALISMVSMVLLVGEVGGVLYILSNQPWKNMLAATAAMSATMLALALCFKQMASSKVPGSKRIFAFGLLVALTIPIATELGILANQPWKGMLAAATSLSMVLLAVTASLAVLSMVGSNVGTAVEAALALSAFIGILGAVMVALGVLFENVSGLEGYLDSGIAILVKLGDGLGRFTGAIVGGVLKEVSNSLPAIGDNLSKFFNSARGFLEGMGNLKSSAFENMLALSAALIAMTAAELVNGVASLFGVGIADLGSELSAFMIGALPFFNGLNTVKPETFEAAKKVVDMILYITAAQLIQGISNFLGTSGSLKSFGEELASFGPSIVRFANIVRNVDSQSVEGASAAAKIMAECAKNLPGTGGLAQKIFGEKSLSEFGLELLAFGPSIVAFANVVKNVKTEAVEGARGAAQIMSELASNLPNQGGLASKIFGDNKLSDFGIELVAFAPSIVRFSNAVKNVDPAAVQGVRTITAVMTELANGLPNTGGIVSWFTGDNDIGGFGDSLSAFGSAFSSFYASISTIKPDVVSSVISEFEKIISLSGSLNGSSGSALVNFSNSMKSMGTTGITEFCNAFTSSTTKVRNAMTTLVTNVINEIKKQNSKFTQAGQGSANAYVGGIRNKYPDSVTAGRSLASNAFSGCQALVSSFQSAGINAGKGFVTGLNSMINSATNAGKALGDAAYKAAKKSLDEHSPSKKMGEVGTFAGLGFINSLLPYVTKASSAGKEIGESTLDGISEVIHGTSNIVDPDLISDPVIRPVVDLSEVTRSVEDINRMFNEAIASISGDAQSIGLEVEKVRNGRATDRSENIKRENVENSYQFNQYNYSPRALSRIDIYRGTDSQFRHFKEVTDQK